MTFFVADLLVVSVIWANTWHSGSILLRPRVGSRVTLIGVLVRDGESFESFSFAFPLLIVDSHARHYILHVRLKGRLSPWILTPVCDYSLLLVINIFVLVDNLNVRDLC